MLARAVTYALVGLEPRRVDVEAFLPRGLPAFAIVGLVDRACQEAKHRVRAGVASARLPWPVERRILVNLAPAALRKEGSGFDLSIALAILAASDRSHSSVSRSTPHSASSGWTVASGRFLVRSRSPTGRAETARHG